jgi:hypothetical protein
VQCSAVHFFFGCQYVISYILNLQIRWKFPLVSRAAGHSYRALESWSRHSRRPVSGEPCKRRAVCQSTLISFVHPLSHSTGKLMWRRRRRGKRRRRSGGKRHGWEIRKKRIFAKGRAWCRAGRRRCRPKRRTIRPRHAPHRPHRTWRPVLSWRHLKGSVCPNMWPGAGQEVT